MISPYAITVIRTRRRRAFARCQTATFQKRLREFVRHESFWSFLIELLLFAVLAAISAWPMINAIKALRSL
ncbi:MAG: hypothetical protein H0X34_17745 [Chthoniobacterales bacterium]|jgi:hypothetical protein|nr:hypothetical protein [Chthoniobacterales bacterium]